MSNPNTPTPTLPELSLTPQRNLLSREDFWTEEATSTLISAWGQRHVELKNGNLRSKHWQQVADAVNSCHPHPPRTDLQCKNRMDTLKKKYKIEISKIVESNGAYTPTWPFFFPLDHLISYSTISLNNNSNNNNINNDNDNSPSVNYDPTLIKKRSYLEIAIEAAAAAAWESGRGAEGEEGKGEDGITRLAKVIEKLGEVYERVEVEKRKQRMEIEKQRLEFVKEMECQRMQMMVEMQVRLQRLKRARKDGTSEEEEEDEEEEDEEDEDEEENEDGVAVDLLDM